MQQPKTWVHEAAERANIPPRTLDQVKQALEEAKANKADKGLALLMMRHGRLTNEALQYAIEYHKHIWMCETYGIREIT